MQLCYGLLTAFMDAGGFLDAVLVSFCQAVAQVQFVCFVSGCLGLSGRGIGESLSGCSAGTAARSSASLDAGGFLDAVLASCFRATAWVQQLAHCISGWWGLSAHDAYELLSGCSTSATACSHVFGRRVIEIKVRFTSMPPGAAHSVHGCVHAAL